MSRAKDFKSRKKPSLRDLPRGRPSATGMGDLVRELGSSSDRVAALLGAIALETNLRHEIIDVLKHSDEATVAHLSGRYGALSTFFSTIYLSYAMGLIPKAFVTELDTIRRIRNAFAHSPLPLKFDQPEVANECEKLQLHKSDLFIAPALAFLDDMRFSVPRRVYVATCVGLLAEMLKHAIVRFGGTPSFPLKV